MERTGSGFDFNFNDIAVFVQVAKQRSISRTAEQTGMPASTVSRRLSMLEERLGVQLLSRTTRRILLTEAGKLYYEHCHQLIEQAQDAQDLLLDHGAQPRGTLKVLLPDMLDAIELPVFIPQFARAWPELQFRYDYHHGPQWEQHRDFDVALRWGTQLNSDLVARSIAQIEFGLYASEDYLKKRGMPKHPGELTLHDCVYADLCKELVSWTFRSSGQPLVVEPQSRLGLSDMNLAHRLACEGAGIVALPLSTKIDESLIPVLPTWRLAPITLYAMYSGRTPPARVRVFIDALIEHAKGRHAGVPNSKFSLKHTPSPSQPDHRLVSKSALRHIDHASVI
ncbi:LysR family transcriptional regulator [Bordetella genomosp. 4]|uniref:HTH lysR-type domain-containing protein n=1 Tax=Bordetella genomosp. 4 TaxID=463044 RepID=A0A261UX38_9BORD|nr:LysR family transcriptional regulator [Bordetella genomosp. 4]OZI66151.1 hypothetical protein CAL20_02235 [Bordetella genomosp. 4]